MVPSENDDVVTSPYNSILSISKLAKTSDVVLPVDNASLFTIYEKIQEKASKRPASSLTDNGNSARKIYDQHRETKKNEAFNTMNNIVANLLLNMTSSMRFEGSLNVDINDLVTNLVPFQSLNFLSSSMTPFYALKDVKPAPKVIDQLFLDAFLPEAQLLSVDPRKSVFLAAAVIARGAIELSDLRRNIGKLRNNLKFVPWNVDAWKTGLCDVAPLGQVFVDMRSIHSLTNIPNSL